VLSTAEQRIYAGHVGARFSRRAVHHCFLSWSSWKSL